MAAVLAVPALAGCAGTSNEADPGRLWVFESATTPAGEISVTADEAPLALRADAIGFATPCSTYSARLARDGDGLALTGPSGGPVGCEPIDMNFEASVLPMLARVDEASEGDVLTLTGPSGSLEFRPFHSEGVDAAIAEDWELFAVSVRGVLEPRHVPASLRLGVDGALAVDTGCRRLSARWSSDASTRSGSSAPPAAGALAGSTPIWVTDFEASAPSCDDPNARSQDNRLRLALQDGFTLSADGTWLVIDSGGIGAWFTVAE